MLLVGLGNSGKKYSRTRHNVGHLMIDWLGGLDGFTLAKTSALMNESGPTVKKLLDARGLSSHNLVLAHDEVDLPLGRFKLHFGRGSAGHKGVKSVMAALHTQDFWRLRIGVGRPPLEMEVEEWVLGEFTQGEIRILQTLIKPVRLELTTLLSSKLSPKLKSRKSKAKPKTYNIKRRQKRDN